MIRIIKLLILFMVLCGCDIVNDALNDYESQNSFKLNETIITASDSDDEDMFGRKVSISGDYAIVGAYCKDGFTGAAYIYKREGGTWVEKDIIQASDKAVYDCFGCSVAISGNYAVVGAYGNDAAYIFKRSSENWIETAKLTGNNGTHFGDSVSISGDYAVIGDWAANNPKGAAYVYKREIENWVREATLLPSDSNPSETANDSFGFSVAIDGTRIIVGAQGVGGDGKESSYIYEKDGDTWVEKSILHANDGSLSDQYAHSVSISGDFAIVGALYTDDKGTDTGSAFIYKRDSGNWIEQKVLYASDATEGDKYGFVSINNEYVVVGTQEKKGTGAIYIYKRDIDNWIEKKIVYASNAATNDYFGRSVSISGNTIIVGAPGVGINSGAAYIFDF